MGDSSKSENQVTKKKFFRIDIFYDKDCDCLKHFTTTFKAEIFLIKLEWHKNRRRTKIHPGCIALATSKDEEIACVTNYKGIKSHIKDKQVILLKFFSFCYLAHLTRLMVTSLKDLPAKKNIGRFTDAFTTWTSKFSPHLKTSKTRPTLNFLTMRSWTALVMYMNQMGVLSRPAGMIFSLPRQEDRNV